MREVVKQIVETTIEKVREACDHMEDSWCVDVNIENKVSVDAIVDQFMPKLEPDFYLHKGMVVKFPEELAMLKETSPDLLVPVWKSPPARVAAGIVHLGLKVPMQICASLGSSQPVSALEIQDEQVGIPAPIEHPLA